MAIAFRGRMPPAFIALALACAMSVSVRAAGPMDGRGMIQGMADAVIKTLRAGVDHATLETRFREMYRHYFDGPGIAAWVIGPRIRDVAPQQRPELLHAVEEYIVAEYAAKLGDYTGDKIFVVGGEEPEDDGLVVNSQIVERQAGQVGNLEVKWRLVLIDGRLKVRDVLIDNVSMLETLRREVATLIGGQGNDISDLIAALRENAAATFDRR